MDVLWSQKLGEMECFIHETASLEVTGCPLMNAGVSSLCSCRVELQVWYQPAYLAHVSFLKSSRIAHKICDPRFLGPKAANFKMGPNPGSAPGLLPWQVLVWTVTRDVGSFCWPRCSLRRRLTQKGNRRSTSRSAFVTKHHLRCFVELGSTSCAQLTGHIGCQKYQGKVTKGALNGLLAKIDQCLWNQEREMFRLWQRLFFFCVRTLGWSIFVRHVLFWQSFQMVNFQTENNFPKRILIDPLWQNHFLPTAVFSGSAKRAENSPGSSLGRHWLKTQLSLSQVGAFLLID